MPEVDLIVPMPLHPKRLAEREFNQALEIARGLARHLRRPIEPRGVLRVKDTLPQTDLPYEERAKKTCAGRSCATRSLRTSVPCGRRHDHRRDPELARTGAQSARARQSRESRDARAVSR